MDSCCCVEWWIPSLLLPPSLSAQIPSSWNEVLANHKIYKVVKTILQKEVPTPLYKKFSCSYFCETAVFVYVFSRNFCWMLPDFFWYLTKLIAISSIVEVAENFYITWTNSSSSIIAVELFSDCYSSPSVFTIDLDDWQ